MKNKNNSGAASSHDYGMEESNLTDLFESGLKSLYYAENQILKKLPEVLKRVSSPELSDTINEHLTESRDQIKKLETVFQKINVEVSDGKSEGIDGILRETDRVIGESEQGAMRDACIIGALQKAEHFEIATYGTLSAFARTLNLQAASTILDEILEQEKEADKKLTALAVSTINLEAAEPEPGEE